MALTFLLTTLWSVEVGVAVSVTISLLLVVHRSSRARMSILVGCKPRVQYGADFGVD
jgi:MFS superfamily sulfate permease-like transporter